MRPRMSKQWIHIYFSEIDLEDYTNMHKKILFYVAIIALFDMFIYPSIASYFNAYAQEPEIKYKQQLGFQRIWRMDNSELLTVLQ